MHKQFIVGCITMLLFFSSLAFAQDQKEEEYELAITKGTFQIETGDYASAIEYFKKARELKPGDKAATLFLGIAYSRKKDFQKAKEFLGQALAIDSSDWRVKYELGVVLYGLGENEKAIDSFTEIEEGDADETLKTAARGYLDRIAGKGAREKKKLSVDLLGGFQYDSNVILDPEIPSVTKEKKADWRALVTVDGKYAFLDSGKTSAEAGYMFYQSVHKDLEDFNVQQHNLKLAGRYDMTERVKLGLKYGFSYSSAGGDHYSTFNQLTPFAAVSFSPDSLTEFRYSYEAEKFFNSAAFSANSARNGNNNAVGLTHTVRLSKTAGIAAGYTYDKDSTDTAFWDYTGHKGSLRVQGEFRAVKVFAAASYYDKKYGGVSAFTEKRHDETQEYSLGLTRDMGNNLSLDVSELYIINDSNLAPYEYKRNIVGLFAVMSL